MSDNLISRTTSVDTYPLLIKNPLQFPVAVNPDQEIGDRPTAKFSWLSTIPAILLKKWDMKDTYGFSKAACLALLIICVEHATSQLFDASIAMLLMKGRIALNRPKSPATGQPLP